MALTSAPGEEGDEGRGGQGLPKKNYPAETKHVFWAHMECGLVLSSVTPWELIPKTKGETRGAYMCKYCKGYWRAGGGGTRLLQIRAVARPSCNWCWTNPRMASTTAG